MDIEKSNASNKGPSLYQYKGRPWSSLTMFFNEVSGQCGKPGELGQESQSSDCSKKSAVMDVVTNNTSDPRGLLQFKRQPWANWITSHVNNNAPNITKQKDARLTDSRVIRLPHQDMGLYGVCPESDLFSAIVCSTCGAVVKTQALKKHVELRHPGETQSFLPPKQIPTKKSRPNILIKKTVKEIVPVSTSSQINSGPVVENSTSTVQAVVSLKPTDSNQVVSGVKLSIQLSPCKPPSSTIQPEPEVANATNLLSRKSPNNDRKRLRDKEQDSTKIVSVQQETLTSARTTPAKQNVQTQKRTNDTSRTVLVHRPPGFNNLSSNKTSPKQILEKYMRKGTKITIWGRPEETPPVHVIHRRDEPGTFKILGQNSHTSNPSNSGANIANTNNTSNVRTDGIYNIKNYSPEAVHGNTLVTSNSNDWSNVHIEKMLFSESDIPDSMLPSLVPSETPEPLPESSSTPQVLTERPPPEPEPPCTPPRTSPTSTPVIQSPNIPSIDPPILDADTLINSVNPFRMPLGDRRGAKGGSGSFREPVKREPAEEHVYHIHKLKPVQSKASVNSIVSCDSNHQLLKVLPPSAPPYSVKVSSSNPVLILSPKEPALPAVNLNVNTESTTPKTVIRKQIIQSSNPASLLKPRAVKVPITVQMPLQEKVTNITFYKNYPKPITLSSFSARKVGGALIFNSKRVNVMRNEFKTVLSKKGRSINTVTLKTCQLGTPGSTMYTAKPLGPNNNCRFPKTISVIPNINASTLLAHRPNILRASLPKQSGQHVPKILATGLKRPATSSPQIANINDCKHLLLTPGNGIISKMIVHPRSHEVTETGDPSPSHILDKVVPVNIK